MHQWLHPHIVLNIHNHHLLTLVLSQICLVVLWTPAVVQVQAQANRAWLLHLKWAISHNLPMVGIIPRHSPKVMCYLFSLDHRGILKNNQYVYESQKVILTHPHGAVALERQTRKPHPCHQIKVLASENLWHRLALPLSQLLLPLAVQCQHQSSQYQQLLLGAALPIWISITSHPTWRRKVLTGSRRKLSNRIKIEWNIRRALHGSLTPTVLFQV